jgi:two-component system, NarL family, response regulator DevR
MLRTRGTSAASPSPLLSARRDDCGTHASDSPDRAGTALVVDSDRFHAGFLVSVLAEEGFDPVRDARTGKDARSLASDLRPSLIVLGAVPDDSVADLVRALSAAHPNALIVVAGEPDRAEALAALSAGARAIVAKQLEPDQFAAVLRAAVTGRTILVSQELSVALASALPPLPDPALSRRELDVLSLLVRGWDNAAIARELHISPSTAKGHVSHILAKLQSENRTDAALQGIRRGLVTP